MKQGACTKWDSIVQRKIKWSDIWHDHANLTFLIRSVYDILQSPANLSIWNKTESALCPLCKRVGSLKHILSSCPTALAEGRYRWRHDQILRVIADIVHNAIQTNKKIPVKSAIRFIKAGTKPSKTKKPRPNILSPASDWELRVDLRARLIFPDHIVKTLLRPDLVFFSNTMKTVVMWELTVPWEENILEAHEWKKSKYDELLAQCRTSGWKATCLPIEVGSRGFTAKSLWGAMSDIGLVGTPKRLALKSITDKAESCAKWLFLKRNGPWEKHIQGNFN